MKKIQTLNDLVASKKIVFWILIGIAFIFIIGRSIMETYDNERSEERRVGKEC